MIRSSGEKLRQQIMLLLSLLIAGAALWTAREAGRQTDLQMRRELARQARSIVATIGPDDLRGLSFTAGDAGQPEFQRLSTQLKTYAETAGLRSLYTMALRDGKLVFGPESLRPGDPYASPPGTAYRTPTAKDLEIFRTGEAAVQGPAADEYGNFVTASVPVVDPRTGQVLMVVGLDVETPVWRAEIRKAQWIPFLTAMVPLGILLAGFFVLRIRQRLVHTHHARLRHTEAVTCAIIMLLLTLIVALITHSKEKKAREDAFYTLAQIKAGGYIDAFQGLRDNLRMLTRFFESSEQISRTEFSSYCAPLLANTPVQACIWLPEVSDGSKSGLIEEVRTKDWPGFSIWQLDEQNQRIPAQGELHYPVLYVEPLSIHQEALGYDLYSEPVRRDAMTEALHSGRATATDPVHLIALPGKPPGFFIFKPVDAKQQKGLAGLAIRPEMLIASQLYNPAGETHGLSITLFQLRAGQAPYWLSCSRRCCDECCWETLQTGLHTIVPVFFFGKTYCLLSAPEPQWLAAHPLLHGKTTLVIGLMLTVLMTTLIATLANRPALLEKRVQQRTKELHESEERFEIAASAASIGVWDRDLISRRLIWDQRMYALYGVRPEDFGGTYEAWVQCIHPDDRIPVARAVANAERGVKDFDTEFRIVRPDGEIRHIKAFGKVIRDEPDAPRRMIGANYDITRSKLAEQQIQSQLNELSRWYQVTLGRETRVLELKKEINEILRSNGQPPRYNETDSGLKNS